MSVRLVGGAATHFRTTDHTEEINWLHNLSAKAQASHTETTPVAYAIVLDAVASLLHTHDATGISLEAAPEWAKLVNAVLYVAGLEPFMKNGV